MQLIDKVKRSVHSGMDPDSHWISTTKRIKHEGRQIHPVRALMNEDLGYPLLQQWTHRLVPNCEYPLCINPRHWRVKPCRKALGTTPKGERAYLEEPEYWPMPAFSWDVPEYDEMADILDDLNYQLSQILDWQSIPAAELQEQLGDPAFTVRMIQELVDRR